MADVTLEMLGVLGQRCLDEMTAMRAEQAAMRAEQAEMRAEQATFRRDHRDMLTVVVATADHVRRLERRIGEMRDDLELMLKAELMGRLGHFEMQMERRLATLEARISPA